MCPVSASALAPGGRSAGVHRQGGSQNATANMATSLRLEQTEMICLPPSGKLSQTENLSKRACPIMTWSFGAAAAFYFHPCWGDLTMSTLIVRWISV